MSKDYLTDEEDEWRSDAQAEIDSTGQSLCHEPRVVALATRLSEARRELAQEKHDHQTWKQTAIDRGYQRDELDESRRGWMEKAKRFEAALTQLQEPDVSQADPQRTDEWWGRVLGAEIRRNAGHIKERDRAIEALMRIATFCNVQRTVERENSPPDTIALYVEQSIQSEIRSAKARISELEADLTEAQHHHALVLEELETVRNQREGYGHTHIGESE